MEFFKKYRAFIVTLVIIVLIVVGYNKLTAPTEIRLGPPPLSDSDDK